MLLERFVTMGALALALSVAATGCEDEETTQPSGGGGQGGEGTGGAPPELPPTSDKAALKLKAGIRFRNDVAQALGLGDDFCLELGRYDCAPIHYIVMGGADAFLSGQYEPLPETTATSPLAFDRVAVAGCLERVAMDFEDPSAATIFIELPIDAQGRLTDPESEAVQASITRLYRKGLARNPSEVETQALIDFAGEVEQTGSEEPAKEWATLSCYAVLTSMENIFY